MYPVLNAGGVRSGVDQPSLTLDCRAGDAEPFSAAWPEAGFEQNRFEDDWLTLHLFATLYLLSEQKQSAFAFLKNDSL